MSDITPGDIKVGVIGAGTMGTGIAQIAAGVGHKVVLYDSQYVPLEKARSRLGSLMEKLVRKGKYTQKYADDLLKNITYSEAISSVRHCDIVLEAIIEDLDVKRDVFKTVESLVSEETILATNTSSLTVTEIAAACKRPDRVIGLHFFNPAPLMKLVEIISAYQTRKEIVDTICMLVRMWGKTPVRAGDTPGFIVNRVARPFYSEALRIHDEGIAGFADIDKAMTEIAGFRMGPFTLMDYIGNDVNFAVTNSVWRSCFFEPRYKPSLTQKKLVDSNNLGRKTGRGYYDYSEGDPDTTSDMDHETLQMIANRIVVMLINEAADAVYWRIASKGDIDLAMTLGVNYPKGLLKWGDEMGIDNVVEAMDSLYDKYREERYRCSPLLREMRELGIQFYDEKQ